MQKMKKWRFLIAWFSGSDAACGDDTQINNADELVDQYNKGNDYVTAYEYEAPDYDTALAIGRSKAFMDNWTAQDSCSDLVLVLD